MISVAAFCVVITTVVVVVILLLPTRYTPEPAHNKCSVQIVVLGDVGRSPRMQYHASSVAQHRGTVEIVGYIGTSLHYKDGLMS